MFKFKKNKPIKTGIHTPKFRNPTPPPPLKPPTSGSNAVKPRPTVFYISPGDLNDWVKTVAQIGDVAYCYIREVEECGMYYYLGPDDNPFWRKLDPGFSEKHSKKENKGDDKMNKQMYGLKLYIPFEDLDAYIHNHISKDYKNHTFIPIKTEVDDVGLGIEITLMSANPIESDGVRYKLDLNTLQKEI